MKRNKIISLMLCIFLISTLLAACGEKDGQTDKQNDEIVNNERKKGTEDNEQEDESKSSAKDVSITYWQHSSQARDNMMKALAFEFMEQNENVKIKMEFIPEADYSTKLISSLATDAAPDVMQVKSGMISRLVKSNAIQQLDENVLSTSDIENDFVHATVEALNVDGKYYGLPTDVQTIVTYWNKDLLNKAGLDGEKGPQTWDEMREWAKKLTKVENGTMVQSGWGTKGFAPEVEAIINQYGGKMVDEDGKFIFADDPKSVEAIKFMVDTYKIDKVYDIEFMKNWAGFRQGKVAMMLGHPAMFGNLQLTAPNIDLGIGLIPAKGDKHTTIVTSWAYVLGKNANSEMGTKFIEYLASEDVEKRWTKETGELPARKALLDDEELIEDSQIALLLSSLNDSYVSFLQLPATYDIWENEYERLILTDEPLEDVLKEIQQQLNDEIAKDLD